MIDDEMSTEDRGLLADLGRVLEAVDAPDQIALEAARTAIGWRRLDAELAELTFDSADAEMTPGTVRSSSADVRLLTFNAAGSTIELEIASGRIVGQIVPPGATTIELLRPAPADSIVVTSDDSGMFVIPDVPAGPFTLAAEAADGSWRLRTSWIIA
jgi:hypothetical protein